jgi:hypothetical protein
VPAASTEVELRVTDRSRVTDREFQAVTPDDHENCFVSAQSALSFIEHIETNMSVLRTAGRARGLSVVEEYALEASFSRTLQNAASAATASIFLLRIV